MKLVERLEQLASECDPFLRLGAHSYDQATADLREVLTDAAKCIRHLELINAEAIKALGEHIGADFLVVPK